MRILVGHATMPSGSTRGIFVWQHPYLEEILCHIKRPMRGVNVRLVWTATKNFPFVSRNPGGGVAVGGMAAHGLVNGMSGVSPTGMSEANLPRSHLRRAS